MSAPSASFDPGLDRTVLTTIARRALRRPSAELDAWVCEPLGVLPLGPGREPLYRCRGVARSGGESLPWSAVLKITSPPEGSGRDGVRDWNRESLLLRDVLARELCGGIAAPIW